MKIMYILVLLAEHPLVLDTGLTKGECESAIAGSILGQSGSGTLLRGYKTMMCVPVPAPMTHD
jgi:hypothetical protein